jgi:hypothetical protein
MSAAHFFKSRFARIRTFVQRRIFHGHEVRSFRIEQVFLIDRRSETLACHALAPAVVARDKEQVAAMLSAIRAFVLSSFDSKDSERLGSLHFGQLEVIFEENDNRTLAAVCRGPVPSDLRVRLDELLMRIEMQYEESLERLSATGDVSNMVGCDELIRDALFKKSL